MEAHWCGEVAQWKEKLWLSGERCGGSVDRDVAAQWRKIRFGNGVVH